MQENLWAHKDLFEEKLYHVFHGELPNGFRSARLQEAMKYALFSKGKRLRPLLVLVSAYAVSADHRFFTKAINSAIAVEYLHTYSLIHDDLPAMDNDDERRGRPSLHRRFDEGLAILAGDAFLSDAFYFASLAPHNAVQICRELACVAGSQGLCAGQAEDLSKDLDKAWQKINQAKTARLFETSARMGALSVGAMPKDVDLCGSIGLSFGMAFQGKDDLEDKNGMFHENSTKLSTMLDEQIHNAFLKTRALKNPQLMESLVEMTFH